MSFSPSPFVPSLSLSLARVRFAPFPASSRFGLKKDAPPRQPEGTYYQDPLVTPLVETAAPQRGRLAGPGAARAVRALDLRGAEESLRPTRGEAPFGGREAVGAHGCTDAMHGEVKKAMTGNQFCFVFFVCSVLFLGSMAVHGRGVE